MAKLLVLHGKDQKKTEEFLQMALRLLPENDNLRQIEAFYRQRLNEPKLKL